MATIEARFPHTQIPKGNIFEMAGLVGRMLRSHDARGLVSAEEITAFYDEITKAPSYDAAVDVIRKWVTVIDPEDEE